MIQKQNAGDSEGILVSSEIIRLTSEKPAAVIPLWEMLAGFLFALIFSMFFYYGFLEVLENKALDLRFNLRGPLADYKEVVLINITDDCIRELGTWPWPRQRHAELLDGLKRVGAKTVAFDLIFCDKSLHGESDDQEFANGIRNFGRVTLPLILKEETGLDNDTGDFVTLDASIRPNDKLMEAAPSLGFIDIAIKKENRDAALQISNPDGVIRKILLNRTNAGKEYYVLGLAAAADYLGSRPVVENYGVRLGTRFLPLHDRYENIGQRVKSYMINYAGGSDYFTSISYSEALRLLSDKQDDIRHKEKLQSTFNNRLVLIGTTATGNSAEDVKFSPYGQLAGVHIHANLLQNILSQRFLHRSTVEMTITLIFVFALGIAYFLWKSHGLVTNFITLGIAALWGVVCVILFNFDIVWEMVPVCLMVPMQWAFTRLVQQFVSLREKNYELARKVRELAIINEVSQAVNYMGDLGKTIDAILSRGVQLLNAERGSLFLLDDKYEELVEHAAVFGVEGEVVIDEKLKEQFKGGKGIAGEVFNNGKPRLIQNVRKDKSFAFRDEDRERIRSIVCVPLMIKDNAIGVMNIVNRREGFFNDEDLQTALTMANQAAVVIEKSRLFNLATIDGLTGLVVHRHFQAKMEEEFRRARRYSKPLAYMMTDIDHFKKFNDTWGHQIGDMVLREVAKIVRDNARDTDIAARYGGEEFGVILPETDYEGAMLLAERLRERVETAAFKGPQGDLKVTLSVGVSTMPKLQPETALEMIKFADDALYICKRNGRNRVEHAPVNESPEPSTDPTESVQPAGS
ncbi:MAG: hypothetical protein CVV42_04140 [Candidatus Riflebacteria bacterium HGW-Riflebacteria-2]|jgi:diguanylate cyclase (GGDEF)-like protein|nr:MAG: hypothetical protein CVV42_04140 [Candidatus Riflebacteria bacterium HGW-Riflebacteria-2]